MQRYRRSLLPFWEKVSFAIVRSWDEGFFVATNAPHPSPCLPGRQALPLQTGGQAERERGTLYPILPLYFFFSFFFFFRNCSFAQFFQFFRIFIFEFCGAL